jgi:hypothetical protein
MCYFPARKAPRRYAELIGTTHRRTADAASSLNSAKDVPLACARAPERQACVFDPLVSRFDTRVHDRGDAYRGCRRGDNLN